MKKWLEHEPTLTKHASSSWSIVAQTNKKIECEINKCLKNEITARIPVLGYGASDCKENCWSHLFYIGEKNIKQKNASLYNENFGSKTVVVNFKQKSQIHLHSNLT
ncbi:MAG: DUF123 domain-containing protein [Candidatus Bathyarchaeota archaeon]|nr:DUF123 domain-containing protein [Candidatus Bathyarchaeota archaeon]